MNQRDYYEHYLETKANSFIDEKNLSQHEADLVHIISILSHDVEWLRQQLAWQQVMFEIVLRVGVRQGNE